VRDVEDVEDSAKLRIDGHDLDASSRHPADVGVLVEIQRARIGGGDQSELEAGGGEDEQLGGFRDAEGLEQASNGGELAGPIEGQRARFQLCFDARKRVVRRPLVVPVRRRREIQWIVLRGLTRWGDQGRNRQSNGCGTNHDEVLEALGILRGKERSGIVEDLFLTWDALVR